MAFELLPSEIIEEIITRGLNDPTDIGRFAFVCKRFNKIANSNSVWKKIFAKKWPGFTLKEKEIQFSPYQTSLPTYFVEIPICGRSFQERLVYLREYFELSRTPMIWKYLYQSWSYFTTIVYELATIHYDDVDIDDVDFYKFDEFCKHIGTDVVMQFLYYILRKENNTFNLTHIYYSKKVIRYFLAKELTKKWHNFFLTLPESNADVAPIGSLSSLFNGALLLEQWICPFELLDVNEILEFINQFVVEVLSYIKENFVGHPCGSVNNHDLSTQTQPLTIQDQRTVLKAINYVFYMKYNFTNANVNNFYDIENSCMHKVVRNNRGIPITLCILYREIALKFGIKMDVINYPGVVLLRWQKSEIVYNDKDKINYGKSFGYITASEDGNERTFQELGNLPSLSEDASITMVLTRMSNNVLRAVNHSRTNEIPDYYFYDQHLIINPNDERSFVSRVMLMVQSGYNLEKILNFETQHLHMDKNYLKKIIDRKNMHLKERKENNNIKLPEIKRRSEFPEVVYTVGMIARHKKYNYLCVIRGWDEVCKSSEKWIIQMRVNTLPLGRHQPFYHVLVEDGSERYAAEENLQIIGENLDINREVPHYNVGKYFQRYVPSIPGTEKELPTFQGYYLANEIVQYQYPEDLNVLKTFVCSGKLSNNQ